MPAAPTTVEALFHLLTSFEPVRQPLADAPFEPYVDWAIGQGLGGLSGYNLEYRLGSCGAPTWAKDRLLSVHQGTLNDNVMKLVGFKKSIQPLEGRRLVMVGGCVHAEWLHPHVGFRPVGEIRLLIRRADLDPLCGFLGAATFRDAPELKEAGPARILSDGHTAIFLYLDDGPGLSGLIDRAVPYKVYGPSVYRLTSEDALAFGAALAAQAGFLVPTVEFVDARELVLGAPTRYGSRTEVPDADRFRAVVAAMKIEKAAWAFLSAARALFPELGQEIEPLLPVIAAPVRAVLESAVVAPTATVGRQREWRGAETVRRLLVS